jgi:hypothetical protein
VGGCDHLLGVARGHHPLLPDAFVVFDQFATAGAQLTF